MPSVSPIAKFLRANHAIPKNDKYGCHFYSPEGLYLGRLTKAVINNYKVINLEVFGEGLKKMYTKSVALGQQFVYLKNNSSPIGVSLIPIKSYMRKIFVDFIERTSKLEDSERTLTNNLHLIAIDENTNVGLYDTDEPFNYNVNITNSQFNKLKHPKFKHTYN